MKLNFELFENLILIKIGKTMNFRIENDEQEDYYKFYLSYFNIRISKDVMEDLYVNYRIESYDIDKYNIDKFYMRFEDILIKEWVNLIYR